MLIVLPCWYIAKDNEYRTFLCARYDTVQDEIYDTIFSVGPLQTEFSTTIKQRAIVEHHGNDKGQGTWRCSREPTATSCPHIVQARHSLQWHIQCDIDALDEDAGSGDLEYAQGESFNIWAIVDND